MNQQIKVKWIEALRSGEYIQGTKALHMNDSYCCLGVLCDLHSKETGTEWVPAKPSSDGRILGSYLEECGVPPTEVFKWAGKPCTIDLVRMNDLELKSFQEIADYIEKNL